jgi:hypothetical protein
VRQGRLPNLLIVGVPKSGTTSLFGYLSQHPAICGADVKEVGFFNAWDPRGPKRRRPDPDGYRAHFAHCRDEPYALEATPSYCYGGQPVIDAIRDVLGTPRVILVLRDPTERLWSAYTFQRSKGNLGGIRSFDDYVTQAFRNFEAGTDRSGGRRLHGLATGFYADYVPAWIADFGSDLRVIFADQLATERQETLAGIFAWLGIEHVTEDQLELEARNVTVRARSARAAALAYRLKRAGDALGILPGPIRERLRRGYLRVNTDMPLDKLDPAMRDRVDQIYRVSNEITATALRAHGTERLPSWLDGS